MFCDNYNPVSGMYCKRLRVLCPEHTKEPKIADHEVGFSLLQRRKRDKTIKLAYENFHFIPRYVGVLWLQMSLT